MQMKNIVIVGNTYNFLFFESLLNQKDIKVVGSILDYTESSVAIKDKKAFLQNRNIPELTFKDLDLIKPDLVVVLTWSKYIPACYTERHTIINLHGALLPKWRGHSANAWAMINGEQKLGYTLHKMNDALDDGDIYATFIVESDSHDRFFDVRNKIQNIVAERIGGIVSDIAHSRIQAKSQIDNKFCYTTKILPIDGKINWNSSAQYIYNLWRVMGYPYGYGTYFEYKQEKYEVTKLHIANNFLDYSCVNGAVILINHQGAMVKTNDGVICIEEIRHNDKILDPKDYFMIGNRFN